MREGDYRPYFKFLRRFCLQKRGGDTVATVSPARPVPVSTSNFISNCIRTREAFASLFRIYRVRILIGPAGPVPAGKQRGATYFLSEDGQMPHFFPLIRSFFHLRTNVFLFAILILSKYSKLFLCKHKKNRHMYYFLLKSC